MKRTRYDSEYERIRREAGLGVTQPEFPETEEPAAEGPRDADRVARAHDDFKQRMGALDDREAEANARRKIAADALTARANESVLRHEYAKHGLRPPLTNGNGAPTVSLPLLLQIGWTIHPVAEGVALLLAPEKKPDHPRRDDDRNT